MTEVLLSTIVLTALVLALTAAVMVAKRVLNPARPVEVTINGTTPLPGATGEKLLSVLKSGGIPIPSACAGAGTCGLCRVQVPGTHEDPLPTELARLSRAEVAEGMRLACQTVVRGPMNVIVPDEFLTAETLTCELVSNTMLAPLIKEVVLRLPEGADFDPRPGSFAQITAPPYTLDFLKIDVAPEHEEVWQRFGWRKLRAASEAPVTRAYSLANRPEDEGLVVMNIRLATPPPGAGPEVPPGLVSSYLFGLKPGDMVEVSGPYGDFGAKDTDREMVFIGGGVGMAPLRSIIHDQLSRVGTDRTVSFWYGARSGSDAFYTEEFRALEAKHPNFRFTLGLSDPGPGDEGAETGFIHQVARRCYLEAHPAPENCEYYLCGPPLMIHAVRAMLDDLGVEEDSIYFDDFGG